MERLKVHVRTTSFVLVTRKEDNLLPAAQGWAEFESRPRYLAIQLILWRMLCLQATPDSFVLARPGPLDLIFSML
jgi:hypothetical protein